MVTFSQDENLDWVADKTYEEIVEAYNAGKYVVGAAYYGDEIIFYSLRYALPYAGTDPEIIGYFQFGLTSVYYDDATRTAWTDYLRIKQDNSVQHIEYRLIL